MRETTAERRAFQLRCCFGCVCIPLILLLLLLAIWEANAYPRGALAARFDLMQGEVRYADHVHHRPGPRVGKFHDLLDTRYGVGVIAPGKCCCSWATRQYLAGYNNVMRAYLKRLHGKDVFEECEREANGAGP